MRTRKILALVGCLACGFVSLTASATVSCFNNLTAVICNGPAQEMIVDYMTGQFVNASGSFPRTFFSLSGASSNLACGVAGTPKKGLLDGAFHGGYNALYSAFLSAFALNREITLQMKKDYNCTIDSIKVRGNGSLTTQPCQESGYC